jgi:DNA polymerase
MKQSQILQEIALQIRAEIERGITLWPEADWNAAAEQLLSLNPPAPPGNRPYPKPIQTSSAAGSPPATASPPPAGPQFGPPPAATGRSRTWKSQLKELEQDASSCTRCSLHETRTNVVFSSGSGVVPLVFVSEAPGANEDAQGEAFVGRAGQLLTKIIAAIGIDRKDVYICNVLKCRPPGNRNPLPDEIAACSPLLMRQLEILKPRVICTLGLFATQLLLETKAPIGKLRGRVFRFRGTPLLPTYHPAALLRNPGLKRTVWEDVQLLRRILDGGLEDPDIEVQESERGQAAQPQATSRDLFESS